MPFKKARRAARRIFGKARRYSRGSGIKPIEIGIGSAVYGVVRQPIAAIIPDIPQLGAYTDNLILGTLGALVAWKGRGMIKKAGLIVLANEAFITSARASQGLLGNNSGSSTSLQNVVY